VAIRFPPEIISYCIRPHFMFSVTYRDVEDLMAERGVAMTCESIRSWCCKSVETTPHAFALDRCSVFQEVAARLEVCAARSGGGQSRQLNCAVR
jgi:transposase-like protein